MKVARKGKVANNNENLNKAGKAKKDEFYTQLVDIENELRHYKDFFKGKTVFCNCDDPYESNFVKYFAMNFNALGLKKLIATSYASSPIVFTQLSFYQEKEKSYIERDGRRAYSIELTEMIDQNGDGAIGIEDFEATLKKHPPKYLNGDGDFRSAECVELLKEADVVVTNPPFSLFRELIDLLEKYHKKYIIIGNVNAITYKEVFPLIMENRLWLGASIHSGDREFRVPDSYPLEAAGCRMDKTGIKFIRVKGVRWFSNVDYTERHERIILYKRYSADDYPFYDNYSAINIDKVSEIPVDYDGVMGVPITFMDKYNPDQFEIVGATESEGKGFSNGLWKAESRVAQPLVKGQRVYKRIFIRRRG